MINGHMFRLCEEIASTQSPGQRGYKAHLRIIPQKGKRMASAHNERIEQMDALDKETACKHGNAA